jgi:hypothetical protein
MQPDIGGDHHLEDFLGGFHEGRRKFEEAFSRLVLHLSPLE